MRIIWQFPFMKNPVILCIVCFLLLGNLTNLTYSQDRFGGMTLYTVRNEMAENPLETLKKISDIG